MYIVFIDVTASRALQQQLSITFTPCFTSVVCKSKSSGICSIKFIYDNTIVFTVCGQVNDSISLSMFQAGVNYTYMAILNGTIVQKNVPGIKSKYYNGDI